MTTGWIITLLMPIGILILASIFREGHRSEIPVPIRKSGCHRDRHL